MHRQDSVSKNNVLKWTCPDTRNAIRQVLAVGSSTRVLTAEQQRMSRMVANNAPNSRRAKSLDEIEPPVRLGAGRVVELLFGRA